MRGLRRALAAALACLAPACAHAQTGRALSLRLPDGREIAYTLRIFPAQTRTAGAKLAPTNAIDTARLLISDLARGRIEDAALLSNAPKQRFALLKQAYRGWRPKDFARAYARYFIAPNRIVAEASIGTHHLVLWRLRDIHYLAGYFFMDVEGKTYLDDWPSPVRTQLKQVLEAYRSGKLALR